MIRPFEPALGGDPSRDFCLWDYPKRQATGPQARSANLLWHALDLMNAPPDWHDMLRHLRRSLGVGETVWGIKQADGQLSIELYFYDYKRLQRTKDLGRILDALAPWLGCDLAAPVGVPWFMVSFDLDQALMQSRKIPALDFYLGSPGAALSAGISYRRCVESYEMRNLYNFFDARREGPEIRRKIMESAHLDLSQLAEGALAWPEFSGAASVVVANKRAQDGLYFTRLSPQALGAFLHRFDYPDSFGKMLATGAFDMHLFDIGVDFTMQNGALVFPKTAFYGLL